jgi:predicted DNA repair protein MutK
LLVRKRDIAFGAYGNKIIAVYGRVWLLATHQFPDFLSLFWIAGGINLCSSAKGKLYKCKKDKHCFHKEVFLSLKLAVE